MACSLADAVLDYLRRTDQMSQIVETGVPGVCAYASETPTEFDFFRYETVVCLNLQGRKQAILGDVTVTYGSGDAAIASHDLYLRCRIVEANRRAPYVALVFSIDVDVIRALNEELPVEHGNQTHAASLDVQAADPELLDAMARLFALVEHPDDAHILGPLIRKEIHFRLMTAPNGAGLRRLRNVDSHESRISRAIAHLHRDFNRPVTVRQLSSAAGMSQSSFHAHFKAITGTTPLQYQKGLRLLEARRILTEDRVSVSQAAFDVGYESATQFSREYARKFGNPPSRDLNRNGTAWHDCSNRQETSSNRHSVRRDT